MSPERIVVAMESGVMFNQARPLSSIQGDAVAEYISEKNWAPASSTMNARLRLSALERLGNFRFPLLRLLGMGGT
jgi:hypothetical protein